MCETEQCVIMKSGLMVRNVSRGDGYVEASVGSFGDPNDYGFWLCEHPSNG